MAASYEALTPNTTPTGAQRSESFVYDQLGNRKGFNVVASRGGITFNRKDNGLNQYLPSGSFLCHYDDEFAPASPGYANGVLMQDGNISSTYNALNQPIWIWGGAMGPWQTSGLMYFGYDPLGRCVKRWVSASADPYTNPATYFVYDGWNLLQEGSSPWSPAREYVHGASVDEIIYSVNKQTGESAFHQYDARGHCTLLTDNSGAITEQYQYDAFGYPYFFDGSGNALPNGSVFGNRFLFTGREWIKEIAVYDFRNRHYLPELGRFIQPDPKEFEAGDYNLYRYCHNDPVNKSDPTGLLAGFNQYKLVYDPNEKHDATHDGWSVQGVPETESKPGGVHLEVDRTVSTVSHLPSGASGATTHQTTASNVDGAPTIHEQINVRYASDAGPKTQTFTRNNEWTHSNDLIKAANSYRANAAAWASVMKMSSSATLSMLQNGAQFGRIHVDSVQEFNDRAFNESKHTWDDRFNRDTTWIAPNGRRVTPHNPIDPESGNPLNYNE